MFLPFRFRPISSTSWTKGSRLTETTGAPIFLILPPSSDQKPSKKCLLSIVLLIIEAAMSNTSKELLDHVERPSLLDGLLLGHKDPPPLLENKHQNHVNRQERPLFTPLPKSQVIGKVKDFLEVMAKANQDLELRAQENPSSNYDIEVLNEDEKKYIQLDLLLGIADLHSNEAVSAAEASMSGFRPSISSTSSDSSDDDDSDAVENNSTSESTEVRRNKRPKVVMLD